ncbi:MAG: hypothetical protein ACK4NS_07820 [Saprospiraceae bacterium]
MDVGPIYFRPATGWRIGLKRGYILYKNQPAALGPDSDNTPEPWGTGGEQSGLFVILRMRFLIIFWGHKDAKIRFLLQAANGLCAKSAHCGYFP